MSTEMGMDQQLICEQCFAQADCAGIIVSSEIVRTYANEDCNQCGKMIYEPVGYYVVLEP